MKKHLLFVSILASVLVTSFGSHADNTKATAAVEEKLKAIDAQIAEIAPALATAKLSGDTAFQEQMDKVIQNLQKEREALLLLQQKPVPKAQETSKSGDTQATKTEPTKTTAAVAGEPEIVPKDKQAEFLKLDDTKKNKITNYLADLAAMAYWQEVVDAAKNELEKAGGPQARTPGAQKAYGEWEKIKDNAMVPAGRLVKQKVMFGKELTPLVNRIESAVNKSNKTGSEVYTALFKDLHLEPLTKQEFEDRVNFFDQLYIAFVARNADEKKKLEDALNIRKLAPSKLKELGLQHDMIILAKKKNGKYGSVEKIMGKADYDKAMRPNAVFGIDLFPSAASNSPDDQIFMPLEELRIEIRGDKAIFPVRPAKLYIVRLAPCASDESNVKFSQAPTKFCIQEIDRSAI